MLTFMKRSAICVRESMLGAAAGTSGSGHKTAPNLSTRLLETSSSKMHHQVPPDYSSYTYYDTPFHQASTSPTNYDTPLHQASTSPTNYDIPSTRLQLHQLTTTSPSTRLRFHQLAFQCQASCAASSSCLGIVSGVRELEQVCVFYAPVMSLEKASLGRLLIRRCIHGG